MSALNFSDYLMGMAIHLSEDEIDDLEAVFEVVFTDINLKELKTFLNEALEVCLTTDNSSFARPEQRDTAILIHKALTKLVEAAWLIVKPQFESDEQQTNDQRDVPSDNGGKTVPGEDKLDIYYGNMLNRLDTMLKTIEHIADALVVQRPTADSIPPVEGWVSLLPSKLINHL